MLSSLNPYAAYGMSASTSTTSVKGSYSYLDITGDLSGSRYGNAGTDSVDVSSMARELLDRVNNLDVFSCIFPDNNPAKGTKSLADVEQDFMADFQSFAAAFGGMVGGGSVTMGLDGKGGMTVEGDDAAANRVSSSVTSTTTARFAVMAARAALVDAGHTVDGFSSSYASDPYSAIRDNIGALEDRLLGFRMQVGGGSAQYGFMREGEFEYSETTASYEQGAAAVDN